MGTSRSVAEFTQKIKRLPDALDGPQTLRVAKVGRDSTVRAMNSELRRVAPGGRLRGVGKKGAKVGVSSQQVNSGGAKKAEYVVKATGPWQLFENGSRPHFIVPKGYGGSRKSRQLKAEGAFRTRGADGDTRGWMGRPKRSPKALSFGGRAVAYAPHPGTKPRHPWRKGRERAERGVPRDMSAAVQTELAKVLR